MQGGAAATVGPPVVRLPERDRKAMSGRKKYVLQCGPDSTGSR